VANCCNLRLVCQRAISVVANRGIGVVWYLP
jgi:hypothetical protein